MLENKTDVEGDKRHEGKPLGSTEFSAFPFIPHVLTTLFFLRWFSWIIAGLKLLIWFSPQAQLCACPTISAISKYRKLNSEYTTSVHALDLRICLLPFNSRGFPQHLLKVKVKGREYYKYVKHVHNTHI